MARRHRAARQDGEPPHRARAAEPAARDGDRRDERAVHGQGSAVDEGRAGIGIGAAQPQGAAAVLDQAAGAGDVVVPAVARAVAALRRVHGHGDGAGEGAVAVVGGVEVDPSPAAVGVPVEKRIPRGQAGARQHVRPLGVGQVGEAGEEQDLRLDRDLRGGHRGLRARRLEAVGHPRAVVRPVLRGVAEGVGGARRSRHAGADARGPAGGREVGLGLPVGFVDRVGCGVGGVGPIEPVAARVVERGVDVRGGDRGGLHAAAHHVEGRVHAGEDAVVAEVGGAGEQFLELLRHQEADAERLERAGIGMAARKGAVRVRVGAVDDRLEQGGHADGGRDAVGPRRGADARHVVADAEGGRGEGARRIEAADVRRGERPSAVGVDHRPGHGEAADPGRRGAVDGGDGEARQVGRDDEARGVGRPQRGPVRDRVVVAVAGVQRVDGRRRALVALEDPLGRLGRAVRPDHVVDEAHRRGERRRGSVAEGGRPGAGTGAQADVGRVFGQRRRGVGGGRQTRGRRPAERGAGAREIQAGQRPEAVEHAVGLRGPVVAHRRKRLVGGARLRHRYDGLVVLRQHRGVARQEPPVAVEQAVEDGARAHGRAVGKARRRPCRKRLRVRTGRQEDGRAEEGGLERNAHGGSIQAAGVETDDRAIARPGPPAQ